MEAPQYGTGVKIARFIDREGKKKIVVIEGSKAIGKFEIKKEFDPRTFEPNWKEIEFNP